MKKSAENIGDSYIIVIGRMYLAVCLIGIPILLFSDTLDPALAPRFVAWSIALTFLALNLLYYALSGRKLLQPPLENYITIALAGYLLVSLFSSFVHAVVLQSAFDLLKIVMFVAHVYVCSIIFKMSGKTVEFAMKLVCICCLLISVTGLLQYYDLLSFPIPGNTYHLPYSTMANKNLFASLLFLMVPIVFYGLNMKGIWPVVNGLVLSAAMLNIVLCRTRAVYLAVGICALSLITWYCSSFFYGESKTFAIPRMYKIGMAIAALSIAAALFSQIIDNRNTAILQTAASMTDLRDQSIHQRLVLWKSSFFMVKDNPWIGAGIGNWQIEYPKYGLGEMSESVQQGDLHFQRPHNDFLWVLSETGTIGGFIYAAVFILAIACCIKIMLRSQSQYDHFIAIALACQVIGFGVISFFDFPKERIEHLVYFGLVLAMINHYSEKYEVMTLKASRMWTVFVSPILAAGILLAVYVGSSRVKSEIYMRQALNARDQGNWNDVIENINKASTSIFTLDLVSTPLSWYSGVAYFSKNDIVAAHRSFLEAYRIHPNHLHVLNNLATCEQLLKNTDKAIELYKKSLLLSPAFEPSLRNLSAVYYNTGLYEEAYRTIQRCKKDDTLAMQYSGVIKSKLNLH